MKLVFTTRDGVRVFADSEYDIKDQCDLVGKAFSDGRVSGIVQKIELARGEDGVYTPKLWFGQNWINVWDAFQVCPKCFGQMMWDEWTDFTPYSGEPPIVKERFVCCHCHRDAEPAYGNYPETYEDIPF